MNSFVQLYQKTYGMNCHEGRVCAVMGQAWRSPEDVADETEADRGYIILQPLLQISNLGPEPLPEGEPEYTYKQDGPPICVDYHTFMGTCRAGQPIYELRGGVYEDVLHAFHCLHGSILGNALQVYTEYCQHRIRVRHEMLHVLGWYKHTQTQQVVRFLGTSLVGTEPYVVLQRLHEGSIDPVLLRPVTNADPINEDGRRDIWNGLEIVPLRDFTSVYWVDETKCQLLYEYIGLEYSEVISDAQ